VVDAANRPTSNPANPVPATTDSIARGRLIYLANCSSCHGTDGLGNGPQAAGMLPMPGDIGSSVSQLSDGPLYDLITNGVVGTQMPAFATSLSENDRWDLVNELHNRWPAGRQP
jgi:putative copper resistance protein D